VYVCEWRIVLGVINVVPKRSITTDPVVGVTSVDDKLFVLTSEDTEDSNNNQVAVYSVNNYKLLRHLYLPEFKPYDMTSCAHKKCLYISDPFNSCILRFDLAWSWLPASLRVVVEWFTSPYISKWSVPGLPYGLSVTPDGNLLVTCLGPPNKLVELSADSGQCVREVSLQPDIERPRHALKLTIGQYLVCHGFGDDRLHRVCLVSPKGLTRHIKHTKHTTVTRSYGGRCGYDYGQLNSPYHLAVDENSHAIFVTDQYSRRVEVLSPQLELACHIRLTNAPLQQEFNKGRRLYFDQASRRLYAGQQADIFVIQINGGRLWKVGIQLGLWVRKFPEIHSNLTENSLGSY